MQKEYGGYLPLELQQGQEWFQYGEANTRRYNCGRTAIYEAALSMSSKVKRIYVPYYVCHTVVQAIEQAGIEVGYYPSSQKMEPIINFDVNNNCEGVLVVNYFGLKDKLIQTVAERYVHMILDCTQAFFCHPVLREGVRNIFSCRKFIGVPDGAYLIEKSTSARRLKSGNSWMRYAFLCKAHELGTNGAYPDSLENERQLGLSKEGMSELTRKVLQGTNYRFIAEQRKNNFERLRALLGKNNRFFLEISDGVPYCYPFLAPRGTGEWMKKKLLEERIYIPTLWKECREICRKDSLENEWTNDLLCLPVDQRYEAADMEHIAKTTTKFLEETSQ